jgi:hypothetical protein
VADAVVGISALRSIDTTYLGYGLGPADSATYAATDAAGATITGLAAPTWTGRGYQLELPGNKITLPGVCRETWVLTYSGVPNTISTYFLVVPYRTPLVQRWELVHNVAELLGDLWTGTCKSAGLLAFSDSELMDGADWGGAHLYVYGGTGAGQYRRVASSVDGVLTLASVWTPTPVAGDPYQLTKQFAPTSYWRAINTAIAQGSRFGLLPLVDESVLVSANTSEYTLPSGLHTLADVWTRDVSPGSTAGWTRLYPGMEGEYVVIPGRRALWLKSPADNLRLRLVGQVKADLLHHDGAYCDLPSEYVAFKAAAHLCTSQIAGPQLDRDGWAQRASAFHQQAEACKPSRERLAGTLGLG